jgi:hypothetical protein
MPCQAQEHSGGRTASRPRLTTSAAVEAALVDAADRGGQPHCFPPRCDKLLEAKMWTETPISVPKIAACGRLRQFVCDRLPVPVTCTHDMIYLCASLYKRMRGGVCCCARTAAPHRSRKHRVTDDLELLITTMAREAAHHHHCSLDAATRQIRALVAEARAEYRAAGAPHGDDDSGFCRLPPRASTPDSGRLTGYPWRSPPHCTANRRAGPASSAPPTLPRLGVYSTGAVPALSYVVSLPPSARCCAACRRSCSSLHTIPRCATLCSARPR